MRQNERNEGCMMVNMDESSESSSCDDGDEREN